MHLRYRPEIDGLRAIAVVSVLLFHFKLGLPGGFVGVDIFFVISGFLITSIIQRDIEADNFRLSKFWIKRIRRITPALVVMTFSVFIAAMLLILPDDMKLFGKSFLTQAGMISNIFFVKHGSDYFAASTETMPLLHTWSLAVEEQFYLIFPSLLLLFKKLRKSALIPLILVFCASLIWSIIEINNYSISAFYLLTTRAWELILGSLLAMVKTFPRTQRAAESFSLAGLGLILFSIISFNETTPFPGAYALIPCLGAALFIWANTRHQSLGAKLLSCKPFVFIGLISYSLYLWHWPLYAFLQYASPFEFDSTQAVYLIIISFILATLSWKFVETPFKGDAIPNKTIVRLFIGITLLSAVVGLIAYKSNDGLPWRFSDDVLEAIETRTPAHTLSPQPEPASAVPAETATVNSPILLWGDSHAMALIPVFQALNAEYNAPLHIAVTGGCPPILNTRTLSKPNLAETNNDVLDTIDKLGIRRVCLVARWTNYTIEKPGWNFRNSLADGSDELSSIVFKKRFEQTLQELRKRKVQVWIMKQIPEQRVALYDLVIKAKILGLDDIKLEHHNVTTLEHQSQHQWVNSLIDNQAEVIVLEPLPYFSNDNGFCIDLNNCHLYQDPNHLNSRGAMLLKELIRPFFLEAN